jgi:hypothetical protein
MGKPTGFIEFTRELPGKKSGQRAHQGLQSNLLKDYRKKNSTNNLPDV